MDELPRSVQLMISANGWGEREEESLQLKIMKFSHYVTYAGFTEHQGACFYFSCLRVFASYHAPLLADPQFSIDQKTFRTGKT